ncbi:magnesium transporter [Thioalkalivibrio sp. K90mix]|uniref:magnesium transporter n=1 Tax=unclassified Thioalkalivibrio TaxID=2621013 RepID=UPI000195A478|nr:MULTISPECIES: magnesium transporter [unclassified Thioalkalivibrio]ADC72185.1 magnesium transporter [Thioalkalivibrio sp. K90mix]
MDLHLEQSIIELKELLRLDDRDGIQELLDYTRVQDIAHALMELNDDDLCAVFNLLEPGRKADVFSYLDTPHQIRLLEASPKDDARFILSEMEADDLTGLLQTLDPETLRSYLRLLPFRAIRRALKQLNYPEDSAGRVMSPDVVAVDPDWTLKRALAFIRRNADEHSNNVIFVVDQDRVLLAAVPIRHFLRASADSPVRELLGESDPITIGVSESAVEAARKIQHYDLETLPVVGETGELLGVITVDDVMDVLEAESTEDFHKIGAVGTLPLSPQDASPFLLYRKRVGWLIGLVAFNTIGALMISQYEEAIEALVVLVFFLPLIIDSGGNAGAQSATLMVRALATGEVTSKDWLRLWGKELGVAVGIGVTMGLAVSVLGLWRGGADIALLVAIAMTLIVAFASMVGMLLPFILSRLKLDPATASVPLITAIADLGGIMIYFSLAVAMLGLATP